MWSIGETAKGSNRGTNPVDSQSVQGWHESKQYSKRDAFVTVSGDEHLEGTRRKTMKAKIVSAIFVTSFALTGCSMDSIFDGGLPFTLFCLGVMGVSGYFVFGWKGED